MKLVATTTALVAALSLFGCATENDGEGGGFSAGLRPAKPSLEDTQFTSIVTQPSPAIEQILNGGSVDPRGGDPIGEGDISAETLNPPFPIRGVCLACEVVVLRDARWPGVSHVLDSNGDYLCAYWVDNGQIVDDGCR